MEINIYKVSNTEIARRIAAFNRLFISSIVASIITAIIFPVDYKLISVFSISGLFIFLFVLLLITKQSFKSLSLFEIQTNNLSIIRTNKNKKSEIVNFVDIKKLKVTWSSRGYIREVVLYLKNGKSVVYNGFENLENLFIYIKSKISEDVKINEYHEPIDFDHTLFYIFLGTVLGFCLSFFIYFIPNHFETINTKFLFVILAFCSMIMSFYFVLKHPISIRYGNNVKWLDYVVSLFLFLAAVFMIVL